MRIPGIPAFHPTLNIGTTSSLVGHEIFSHYMH